MNARRRQSPVILHMRSPEMHLASGIRAKYSNNIEPAGRPFFAFGACGPDDIDTPYPASHSERFLHLHAKRSPAEIAPSTNAHKTLESCARKIPGLVEFLRLCRLMILACYRSEWLLKREKPNNLFQPVTLTKPDRYPRIFSFVRDRLSDIGAPRPLKSRANN